MRRPFLAVFLAGALSTVASGQAPPCTTQNDGNAFNDNMSMGATLIAWQFHATAATVVTSMETFTGESNGTATLGIWTDDSVLNQPGASLGVGTWHMSSINSWQGAVLNNPVLLEAGARYWIVWGNPGGAQAAVDPPKTTVGQVYKGSFDGGANWNGPFQSNLHHWKVRMYCDDCSFVPLGSGCAGTNGVVPKLEGFGCPSPGTTITLRIEAVVGNAAGLMFVGTGTGAAEVVPGCALQILPLTPLIIPAPVSAAGVIVYTGVLPADTPAGDVYLQALFPDAGAPAGLSATNPLKMKVK